MKISSRVSWIRSSILFAVLAFGVSANAQAQLFTNLLWFSTTPLPEDQEPIFRFGTQFQPLQPIVDQIDGRQFGWFDAVESQGFNTCIFNTSYIIGPYGTSTLGLNRSCGQPN